ERGRDGCDRAGRGRAGLARGARPRGPARLGAGPRPLRRRLAGGGGCGMSALLAASNNGKELWYLTRGSGAVALLLLTASVLLGVMNSTRWRSTRWPRFLVFGLHRNITL